MSTRRVTDDSERSVFRSDRFFYSDGSWFFATREASIKGPFERKPQAEDALRQYIAERTGKKDGWNVPGAAH